MSPHPSSPPSPIAHLANFRYALRRFLSFSEQAAAQAGLTPQQHQLLLQIAGAPPDNFVTIAFLAERLALRHNSVVELSDRCEEAGLILRRRPPHDRRLITLELTARASAILHTLSAAHARELHELAPELIQSLERISSPAPKSGPEPTPTPMHSPAATSSPAPEP